MSSSSSAWKFSIGEEDWGPVCVVRHEISGATSLTVISSQSDFNPSLLFEPYREHYGAEIKMQFRTDERPEVELSGGLSDYFGTVEVPLGLNQIDEMVKSNILILTLNNQDQYRIDLRGAGRVLKAFLNCARR